MILTGSRGDLRATGRRIDSAELLARAVDGEEPLDARLVSGCGVAPTLRPLGSERRLRRDAAVEALLDHHADLDLDHVEPAGVLRRVVKLEPAEDATGLAGCERLVERSGRVGREVVEDDADAFRLRVVRVDEVAHALGEVDARRVGR